MNAESREPGEQLPDAVQVQDPGRPSGQDEASRWLISGDLPCLGDGYNLRGLVGPKVRCPECGHINDLTNPAPWREKDLPLGVKQREHWPAQSAGLGLLMFFVSCILMFPGIALLRDGAYLLPLIFVLMMIGGWYVWWKTAKQFVDSARTKSKAVWLLLLVHFASAATLVGSVSLMLSLDDEFYGKEAVYAWCLASFTLIGPALILWAKRWLVEMDSTQQFRVDWREYQLPVAAEGDSSTDAAT